MSLSSPETTPGTETTAEQAPRAAKTFGVLRRNRTRLMAGALALAVTGVLTAQTVVPSGQFAFADPVRVDDQAPADFTGVVKAVQPAVVSVKVTGEIDGPDANGRDGRRGEHRGERGERHGERRFGFGNPPEFFKDLPRNHPFRRFWRDERGGDEGRHQRPRRFGSQGSGFFISPDGYIVTNQHVVERGSKFTVVMDDGTELDAQLIGADERTDLALLKVENGEHDFTYVEFAPEAPQVGQWVVAVGNPFGLGGTVTAGIVSARGRDIGAGPYDDFIQIDAPVNRGNSGGPAFNTKGEVIGINAAIFSPSGGNVGIAFAIPADTAKQIVADLKDDGHVVRGWLGVQIQPVSRDIADGLGLEDARGALVADTPADGPAKTAGIETGDAIVAVDGKKVKGPRQLARMIASYAPGSSVDVTVWRDGSEKNVTVELGTLPGQQAAAAADDVSPGKTASLDALGLELANAREAGLDQDGVVVANIDPDGPAARKGLRQGDIIVEAGGESVTTADDVAASFDKAETEGRKAVLLRVITGERSRFVAIPAPKA